ncbi:MAG: type II toxin-antitoxin system VapC family toxin [Thiohalocapsa sp.]
MRLLLDTHGLIWWRDDSPRLSANARNLICDPANQIFVSVVTLWEIVLKRSTGKLHFADDLEQVIQEEAFTLLPIAFAHLRAHETLPLRHKDPFDRMLLAQAMAESAPLVTNDRMLRRYGLPILW